MRFFHRTPSGDWIAGISQDEIKERTVMLSNEREFDSNKSDD